VRFEENALGKPNFQDVGLTQNPVWVKKAKLNLTNKKALPFLVRL